MSSIETSKTIRRVAVMGAGAVGAYFGGMLARAGVEVTLIGRPAHVDAIRRNGLFLEAVTFQEHIPINASTEPSAVRDADVVLFCVKTPDTETSAKAIAPYLSPGAIVVSLQNGVDNVPQIRAATGIDAMPCIVYVAAEMPGPGHMKHSGRGELVIGEFSGSKRVETFETPRTERIAALFAGAGVPCRISANIETDMWAKFILNCAGNALTAITQTDYLLAFKNIPAREVAKKVVEETVAVARAAGVSLPETDFAESSLKYLENAKATSSTAQDIARGKRTEIDSFNGYIARRGSELGIPTPVSFTMYALVKLIEDKITEAPNRTG